jgi:hypothetical protein
MGQVTPLPIALRAYLVPDQGWPQHRGPDEVLGWSESMLILDTETTTDPSQQFTFGSFRQGHIDRHGAFVCLEEGLIVDDALSVRDPAGYACLEAYVATHRPASTNPMSPDLLLWSRRQFLRERLWPAIRGGTLIVGFNLPFDLTRLSLYAAPARGKMFAGGFSLAMFEYDAGGGRRHMDPHRPRFRFKAIDGKRSLMGFARRKGGSAKENGGRAEARGRLLDLRHLVFALTDKKLSLEGAAKVFGLPDQKLPIVTHGVISEAYIDYNRQDVALTVQVLEAAKVEWDRHPIEVAPDRVMSPAGMAKGYLHRLGLILPMRKFKIPPEILGAAQVAYFGGRTEVRVRRVPVPVAYVDFRSMYPTVNALMQMWDVVTAAHLDFVPDTAGVQHLMASLTLEQIGSPAIWPNLRFFAKVLPKGDVLPVRAEYDPTRQGTSIGVNPLWSDTPIWFAGPDLVASWLATGQVPDILEVVRMVPVGRQRGLRPVKLRGQIQIDPASEDFFRRVIELRHELSDWRDLPDEERDRLVRLLKVLANSGSYGIFAELNPQPLLSSPVPATVYGLAEGVPTSTQRLEEPGEFWCAPMASLTTAAARLMLALLERRVTDAGGQIAFGDTDSAAIVSTKTGGLVPCPGGPTRMRNGEDAIRALSWDAVDAIVASFTSLNPYDKEFVSGSILRVEKQNFDASGMRRTVFGYAISAKRYALFTKERRGGITVVDAKEHGLGHLMNPLGTGVKGRAWIAELWKVLILQALGRPLRLPAWVDRPAMTRITVSTVSLWLPYRDWNRGKSFADQVKPMNFGLSLTIAAGGHPAGADPQRFHLVGIFEKDPSKWLEMEYMDRYSGKTYQIGVGRTTPGTRVQIKSVRDVIEEYAVHPEPKSLGPDGEPCGRATIGLLQRRSVHVSGIVYIGKESNALEEVEQGLVHAIEEVQPRLHAAAVCDWDLVVLPVLRRIPLQRLVEITGLGSRVIRYYWDGERHPSPEVEVQLRAEAVRWARRAIRRKRLPDEEGQVAERLLALVDQEGLRRPPPQQRRRRRPSQQAKS